LFFPPSNQGAHEEGEQKRNDRKTEKIKCPSQEKTHAPTCKKKASMSKTKKGRTMSQ
jgi:hypothetical protein